MRFSKEARIGLVVASAILIFFAGFYFLKGANIFSGENEYFAYYDNVQGLQPSSPVQIKGLGVGRVSAIELNGNGRVKVTLAINKKNRVPVGTIAKLTSTDLLGSKAIALELGNSTAELPDESEIKTSIEGGIIDAVSAEITPLLQDMRRAVVTLDTVLVGINGVLDMQARENLKQSIASLDVTMANFSQISTRLNNESGQMASVIRNANSITTNLASNNERITRIINNVASTSDQLSKAPVEQTMRDLQTTISQLQGVVNKINSKDGSLGLLVNDQGLYNNLNSSLTTLNSLMADIEAHPARYINLTIFGRRKVENN
ncbi:MAG: MCE family protein [Sphingobacteriales bacterium]|nr:MAG: MCE family protein [Sphingobacteriales bacterium]